jgi:hypothetical protein
MKSIHIDYSLSFLKVKIENTKKQISFKRGEISGLEFELGEYERLVLTLEDQSRINMGDLS